MNTPKESTTNQLLRRLNISTPLTPDDYHTIENGADDEDLVADLTAISPATSLSPEPLRPPGDDGSEIDHMRQEIKRRDLIIESLKRQHAIKVTDMDSKLAELVHQKHLAELQLEHEVRRFEVKLAKVEENTRDEVRQLRHKQQQLESQNPLIRERLDAAKEEMKENILVSESCYLSLKAVPEIDLSFQEFVQVLLFENEQSHRHEKERLHRDFDAKSGQLLETTAMLEQLKRETDRKNKVNEDSIRQLQIDLNLAEQRCSRYDNEAKNVRQSAQDLSTKGEMYDKVKNEAEEAQRRLMSLEATRDENDVLIARLKSEVESLSSRLSEETAAKDLLERDKAHFQHRETALNDTVQRYRGECEGLSSRLADVIASRESLHQQLLTSGEAHRSSYDEQLRAEVSKIQQETRQDLEKIHSDARDIFARENNVLREARDAAIIDADRYRVRVEDAETRRAAIETELRQLQASSDARVADSMSQLRIKSFECERLKIANEEATTAHKAASLDAESLRQKVDVLKQEYYTLQSVSSSQIAALESSNGVALTKLKQYEALEVELDNALLIASDVDRITSALPTSSARRMQQTAQLSRRVVELQKEKIEVEESLTKQQDRCGAMEKELNDARHLLSQTKQPYTYFIDTIREKESECEQMRMKLGETEAKLKKLEEEKVVMLADLKRMASVRDGLDSLKTVVHGIKGEEKKGRKGKKSGVVSFTK